MNAQAVEAMLSEDRAEWAALVAVLEAHPDEPLHDPNSPSWTSRDAYTHLARWIEHSTQNLEALLADGKLTILEGSDDEINARWQQEDSRLSLDEARERAQRAFEHRIQAIEAAPRDRWDAVLKSVARADGADHYAGHRRYIAVRRNA